MQQARPIVVIFHVVRRHHEYGLKLRCKHAANGHMRCCFLTKVALLHKTQYARWQLPCICRRAHQMLQSTLVAAAAVLLCADLLVHEHPAAQPSQNSLRIRCHKEKKLQGCHKRGLRLPRRLTASVLHSQTLAAACVALRCTNPTSPMGTECRNALDDTAPRRAWR